MSIVQIITGGGYFMYLVLFLGLLNVGVIVLQGVKMRAVNVMPLAWALVAVIVACGVIGHQVGLALTYEAVAAASAETKMMILRDGQDVAMYTLLIGLVIGVMQSLGLGVIGSVIATKRLSTDA